jgi:tetratricopeptide (TPR) repeat protein
MNNLRLSIGVLATLLASAGADGQTSRETAHESRTPWYDGIGRHSRKITTTSHGAQGYFDQGLAFLMAANPDEAVRSFEEAARFDPQCAMVYWGISVANGPLIGQPPPTEAQSLTAVAAINRAHELASRASPVEQALIAAVARRCADPPPENRQSLDLAYAAALRDAWRSYPEDADVGALFAAALLLAQREPWWTPRGDPYGSAAEAVHVLEAVRQLDERHPLANRLTALIWEGSRYPEKADAAAEVLRELAPGLGHFAHLAARIDARRGRWTEAIETSLKVLAADARYLEMSGRPAHRYLHTVSQHRLLLVQAAAMTGRQAMALEQARALTAAVPDDWSGVHRLSADGLASVPLQVLARFGSWDAVLAEPAPGAALPLERALRHAARGLAFAERRETIAAREELQQFLTAAREIPAEATWAGQPARTTARIAAHVLAGWIELAEGDTPTAVAALEEAVKVEDGLGRAGAMLTPLRARQVLGSALLRLRRIDAAEAVYRADLERSPENGWALYGLLRCLQGKERLDEAADVEKRLAEVWKAAEGPEKSGWFDEPSATTEALAAIAPGSSR